MASRKEEKERLRRERLRAEEGERVAQRRRRAIQLGSVAVLGALVIVAVLIAVSQSGGGGGSTDIQGAADVESLLQGIPQRGTTLGEPGAKVTIVEYGDLQCPVCKQYSETVIPDLIKGPVRSGVAKLEFRNWVIIGPESMDAAKAALAASRQGRYWTYIELFYRNQGQENSGYVTDEFMTAVAKAAGLPDLQRWDRDRASGRWDAAIAADASQAQRYGFSGTPSFVVAGPGGTQPLGTPGSAAAIERAIKAVG